MSILITGGAGFIGSHLSSYLIAKEQDIIIVDNLSAPNSISCKKNLQWIRKQGQYSFYENDITDLNAMEAVFKENRVDTICHLAGTSGLSGPITNPYTYEKNNVQGTLILLESAVRHGVERFIYASAFSQDKKAESRPLSEKNSHSEAVSPYIASTRAVEMFLYSYHCMFDIQCTSLRLSNLYGSRCPRNTLIYKLMEGFHKKQALEYDGTEDLQDWLWIEDAIQAFWLAIDKQQGYEIFNIGTGKPVRSKDIVSLIEQAMGKSARQKAAFSSTANRELLGWPDITKAKRKLGFNPTVYLRSGTKRFAEWYLASK